MEIFCCDFPPSISLLPSGEADSTTKLTALVLEKTYARVDIK